MRSILGVLCVLLVVGCGGDDSSDTEANDAGDHDHEKGDHDEPEMLREVPCTDTSVSTLMLFDEPATGKIREEGKGDEFVTFIDATAGGMNATQSYVYARFTEKGLEKVDITDEDAFESTGWQIAFRRYVIRLNSGVSGPGDIRGGRTAPMTQFADLKDVPDDLELRTEEYFTSESCEFVSDGSGIGAPATALASFWTYKSCLQMTKNVYVISLPKKKFVKLEVLAYYSPDNQKRCDETGEIGIPSGAGSIRIRWAFLD
jgi:hypothetical protein